MANWGWDTLVDFITGNAGVALSVMGMPQVGVPLAAKGYGGVVGDAGAPTDEEVEEMNRPRMAYRPSPYLPWNKQEPSQADELMNRPTPRPDIMSYLSKFIPRSY